MERYQATVFYGVPTLYEYLKDHKDTDKANWRRLKLILSGADTLHESTMSGWAKRTGSKITEGYGLSETCGDQPHQSARAAEDRLVRLPGAQHAGRGDQPRDAGVRRRRARPASCVLAGPNVMLGYWQTARRDARACSSERGGVRWLRTGDLVRMDEEGYFHFYDRSKDLIKYKGYSIFAKDVEDVLYGHPQVKAAGVIGVRRPGGRPAHQGDRRAAGRRARQGERGRDQGLLPESSSPSTRCRTSSSSAASCRRPTSARSRAAS